MHGIAKADLQEVIGTIVRAHGAPPWPPWLTSKRNVMAPAAPFEKGAYPRARPRLRRSPILLAPQGRVRLLLDSGWMATTVLSLRPAPEVQRTGPQQARGLFTAMPASLLRGHYCRASSSAVHGLPGDNSV